MTRTFITENDVMPTKKCGKCQQTKDLDDFYGCKSGRYGKSSICKKCHRANGKAWNLKNLDHVRQKDKERRIRNKEKLDIQRAKWKAQNPAKTREMLHQWRTNNPDRIKFLTKRWKLEHPDIWKVSHSRAVAKIMATPNGKLHCRISRLVNHCLHGRKGYQKWETLVGYTTEQLKEHLEKQFTEGMTWDNYGEWHVDHIIPRAAFNFEIPEDIDFKRCWSLKNLRPLWAIENISKGAKLKKPFQPALAIQA
jgi:hypothetical protein